MSCSTPFDTISSRQDPMTIGDLVDGLGSARPVLVAVWAHPDDESFLGAGFIAEVARRGGRVINVSATLGEHGTSDAYLNPPEILAARRRRELHAALDRLGVERSITLGYADGGCELVPESMGARRVGSIIDEIEPDAVVTFGEDGVTGHPDHRAVARWTELALADSRRHVPLITTASGVTWHEALVERMHDVGAFWPGYPQRSLDGPIWPVRLDGELLEQKLDALACHRSQIGPLQDALGVPGYRRLASAEAYRPGNSAALNALSGRAQPAVA